MTRSAALLCVHNARKDLHWWVAHHLAVGFDTLLICDDHSDDGTWEFLQEAAHRYDIRIARTDLAIDDKITRYETAQRALVQQASQSLSWILPLTLDEYFYPESDSVREFITQLNEKHGEDIFRLTMSFPINWCIFGLNGHDPDILNGSSPSPRALFTRHAPHAFEDHKVVRFICRPEALYERLPDPFSWHEHDVDWSYGRIIHDAAASSQGIIRHYYDRNDDYFTGAERFLDKSDAIAATLIHTALLTRFYQLGSSEFSPGSEPSAAMNFKVYELLTKTSRLTIDSHNGQIIWLEKSHSTDSTLPLYFIGRAMDKDAPQEGQLLWGWKPYGQKSPFYLPEKPARGCLEAFLDLIPLHFVKKAGTVSFINRLDHTIFLSGDFDVSFKPIEVNETLFPDLALLHKNMMGLLRYGASSSGLIKAIKENTLVSPSSLASALFALPEAERATLIPLYLQDMFCLSPPNGQ